MELTFELPRESRDVRLDPIDAPCTMVIDTIRCTDAGGNPVAVKRTINAELSMDATAFFMHKNPEIILRGEAPHRKSIREAVHIPGRRHEGEYQVA